MAAKKHIFISYRRSDTSGETGRLVASLKEAFDEDQIFMDIDKLEPGVDFTVAIPKYVRLSTVMLAVIGPAWAVKNSAGGLRVLEPEDWVRIELETAFKQKITVIPVLVDNARMPEKNELPEKLQVLLTRHAYEISSSRWDYDTNRLCAFLIKSGIQPKLNFQRIKSKVGLLAGAVFFAILLGLFYFFG